METRLPRSHGVGWRDAGSERDRGDDASCKNSDEEHDRGIVEWKKAVEDNEDDEREDMDMTDWRRSCEQMNNRRGEPWS